MRPTNPRNIKTPNAQAQRMKKRAEFYTPLDAGLEDYYVERYRERVRRQLAQRAEKMGMKLIASEQHA